jgi:uncharacterized phage protein (TIGR01671 family)
MREIEFRGKREDTGDWVYGRYIGDTLIDQHYIVRENAVGQHTQHYIDWKEPEVFTIDPETVGQYTGLEDKNGVKIFEGDVVRDRPSGLTSAVYWDEFHAVFCWRNNLTIAASGELEVIGNIHDNPERIRKEERE